MNSRQVSKQAVRLFRLAQLEEQKREFDRTSGITDAANQAKYNDPYANYSNLDPLSKALTNINSNIFPGDPAGSKKALDAVAGVAANSPGAMESQTHYVAAVLAHAAEFGMTPRQAQAAALAYWDATNQKGVNTRYHNDC